MAIQKIEKVIKEYIKNNKFTFLSLFLFYVIGITLGAFAVNDLNFQQTDELTKYFNGFLKLLDGSEINKVSLFKISILDNVKVIVLFWILGFTIIGIPIYYIVIGMRGFSTGFSSGVIMGVLGSKGVIISTICFLPKEIIVIPCLIAISVNGIRLTKGIFKNWFKKSGNSENGIKQRIGPYSFVTVLSTLFIFVATIFEVFISVGALNIMKYIT